MTTLHRTVRSSADAGTAFAYLADFGNAVEWDSGTVSCDRVSGDGGPGTVYRNVSRFAGREVELEYTVERLEAPTVVLVGRNATTRSTDTITVRPVDGGCEVDYRADFEFSGPARFVGPLLRPLLEGLANRTEQTLADALERLPRS